ncbi:uncharacterized protein [Amphiura filiformis]|uniref:uncharacterized protein n=1 Tax=Amphiura filiformis TaxID=82378 RepID=UPI003B215F4A
MDFIGQGKAYCKQAQNIILNVWGYFSTNGTHPVKETIEATGVKRDTLMKLRKNGIKSPKKNGPKRRRMQDTVDEFDRGVIRRIIQNFYIDKCWPTVAKIYEEVKQQLNFKGSISTLRRILKHMGYKYASRPTREIVKERPDIVAKRHTFLTSMQKLRRSGRPIVYLDETWLNTTHTVGKCWLDDAGTGGLNVPTGKGRRLIILHAGSEDGFIPNCLLSFESKGKKLADYHDEMNGDCFLTWFKNQLLPNIKPNSLIIMDNAPYHSMLEEKVPTLSNGGRKADMQQWLRAHNVDFERNMIRVQLDQLIQAHKSRFPVYVIDKLAAENGHLIIRLPPYHCEFNAIELMWAQVKGGVAIHNKEFKMTELKRLLDEELRKVTPENWFKACKHVEQLENTVFDAEIKIDTTLSESDLASFRFCPYADDSDTDDSESDWSDVDSSNDEDELMWIPAPEVYDSETSMSDDDYVTEYPQWTGNEH